MKLDAKKVLLVVVCVIVGYLGFKFILPYFIPFLLALIFSLLIEPVIKILQRKLRLSRIMAVSVVIIGSLITIILFFSALIFSLITELIELSHQLPKYQEKIESFINETVAEVKYFYYVKLSPDTVTTLNENIGAIAQGFQNIIISVIDSFLAFVTTLPQSITGGVTLIIFTLLATFFISKDKDVLIRLWLKVVPASWGHPTLRIVQEMVQAFFRYLKAQLVLISITTIISIIGLFLIGANYALTTGLLIGFFDFIPLLGPSVIFIPWVIWSFITGNSFFGVKLLILYAIVLIVRQVLETKVVASSLGLHPLVALLSLYLGLKLFGVLGMIIGPIMAIALLAVFKSGVITTLHIRK